MSTPFSERAKLIRIAEGLSQKDFADITGISINTVKGYENKGKEISSPNLFIITNHPRFQKYTLWLMTSNTSDESGQISPALKETAVTYNKTGTDTD